MDSQHWASRSAYQQRIGSPTKYFYLNGLEYDEIALIPGVDSKVVVYNFDASARWTPLSVAQIPSNSVGPDDLSG